VATVTELAGRTDVVLLQAFPHEILWELACATHDGMPLLVAQLHESLRDSGACTSSVILGENEAFEACILNRTKQSCVPVA
jgi:hypothetical protein